MSWFKRLYRKLFPAKVTKPQVGSPDRIIRKIALVVGHESSAPGALAVTGLYERYYWGQVCAKIKQMPLDKEVVVIYRDGIGVTGAMKRAQDLNVDMIMELHFNSYNTQVGGCEALYTSPSYWLAKEFCDFISTEFGLKNRGPKDIRDMSRGTYNVRQGQKVAKYMILCEPFFGDNKNDYIHIEPMANAMVKFINKL